jgi:hypothetical protein
MEQPPLMAFDIVREPVLIIQVLEDYKAQEGVTWGEVARRCGVTLSTLDRWRSGVLSPRVLLVCTRRDGLILSVEGAQRTAPVPSG